MPRMGALLFSAALGTTSIAAAQSLGAFIQTGSMTAAHSLHSATLLANGQVLIAGGGSDTPLDSAELFDPPTASFRALGQMTEARRVHTATLLADERVLIVGGYNGHGEALVSAELYDPSTQRFTPTGALITARAFHTAVLLDTGEVLVIGGYGTRGYPNLAPAEIYDPTSGTFREAAAYVGRGGCDFCAPAVRLQDGTVLFAGQTPAQVYHRADNTFTPSGVMTFEPSAAATLANGQVLLAGGETIGRQANAAIYNPAAAAFTSVADMSATRVWHTLTALPDGTALVAGGETDSCSGRGCAFGGSVASAELYDPSAGSFTSAGTMTASREVHTATLLTDGRVLMAGGVAYGGIGIFYGMLATAELYTPNTPMPAPSLVALASNGRGQGAIYHAGTRYLTTGDDPAMAGEAVDLTVRGLATQSVGLVRVSIGWRFATVQSVTTVADSTDLSIVRVRVPLGVAAGPAVQVRLFAMDRPSNDVTMAVR
jgi:hypothetical protein